MDEEQKENDESKIEPCDDSGSIGTIENKEETNIDTKEETNIDTKEETNIDTKEETNIDNKEETNQEFNTMELSTEYMQSLLIYFDDYDINTNFTELIKNIFYFLLELNNPIEKINKAIIDYFNNIYPEKEEDVRYILSRLENRINFNNRMTLSTNTNEVRDTVNQFVSIINDIDDRLHELEDLNTDNYTNEQINPLTILSLFENNLNILLNIPQPNTDIFNLLNSNTSSIYINIPPIIPSILPSILPIQEDVKNVATENILDENTDILEYHELTNELKEKYKSCSICIDDYSNDNEIRKLHCNHVFHKDCIDPWLLKESYKCPICRDDTLPHENI